MKINKNILKKYLTNRKRQDIMKSQTKKNNSSKILEINLTRNLKKEVQSNGTISKIQNFMVSVVVSDSFQREKPFQMDENNS